MAAQPEHVHEWKLVVHLDGCHFYSSSYQCECEATRTSHDERDFNEPMSTVWALPDECPRCAQLLEGAPPTHSDEILERV